MKKVIMWTLTLLIMLMTGCQVTAPQTSVETYSNTRFGFSVNYPGGWKVSEDDYETGTTIIFSEKHAAEVYIMAWEAFTKSENPLVQRMAFQSLEDFCSRAITAHWEAWLAPKSIEEHNISIDGLPAKEVIMTYTKDDGSIWKKIVVGFLDTCYGMPPPDSAAFKIIYEARIDMFDDYNQDFRLIADTFKFTE